MDAGTWGTMGVGLGYAIAAATARPDRLSIAVEGDSAFGFSGMECETICRYALVRACYCLNTQNFAIALQGCPTNSCLSTADFK